MSRRGAVSEVGKAPGVAFEVFCGSLAVPCNVINMDGSCGACGESVDSEDDKEAAIYGGDASNDAGARSGAATGIVVKLRSSIFGSRSPKFVSVRILHAIRSVNRIP